MWQLFVLLATLLLNFAMASSHLVTFANLSHCQIMNVQPFVTLQSR